MAAEGFLTSMYAGKDVMRPTFFEIIAQESLMDALRPALKHVVSALAQTSTSVRVLWCAARFETGYNIFLFLLEWWHLRLHSASFAEHFFGLRRQESAPKRVLTPLEAVELQRRRQQAPDLTSRQRYSSLLVMVLLPFLRRQCESRFREAEDIPKNARSKYQSFLVSVYPWIHAVSASVGMSYRVAYLLEQTDIWSPSLHALQLSLVRHFPAPPTEDDSEKSRSEQLWDLAGMAGSGSLWAALYLMQFAQWWYQSASALQPYHPRKVPPPPPQASPYEQRLSSSSRPPASAEPGAQRIVPGSRATRSVEGASPELVLLPQDRRICPLCHRVRRNPALASSGYAFCFTCLVPYVEKCGCCPVTGQATSVEQIRRIRDG